MSELNFDEDAQSGCMKPGSQSEGSQSEPSSQPVESSAFPDEDEETITMLDVIEREDKLEDEASAVLGFSDEKNCTYPKGYISRQALYSCATCSDGPDNYAAICLACSLECHENHELFELYTKRNYRCDCGNDKFKKGFECKLMDKQTRKAPLNENNKYNHNFSGLYCTCNKRYPPDESDDSPEASDEMLQCIVCEDWYHSRHLQAKELPAKFDELICGSCADRLEFVHYYKDMDTKEIAASDPEEQGVKNEQVILETNGGTKTTQDDISVKGEKLTSEKKESTNGAFTEGISDKSLTPCENDTNDSQAENKDPAIGQPLNNCLLEKLKKNLDVQHESKQSGELRSDSSAKVAAEMRGPIFWQDCQWRSKLCRCSKCMLMYREKECEYLIDDRDTVQYYEAQGRAMAKNRESPYERGMSALNRMNRAAVVEALHGYDELKADLSSYLRKFADTKKVVREEDIHDFFAQLKTKKRQKLEYE